MSSEAESDCPAWTTGSSFFSSSPKSGEASDGSRAASALRLPLSALISPLCAMARNGWASSQEGKVFVEYRWWTIANGVTKSGSERSG